MMENISIPILAGRFLKLAGEFNGRMWDTYINAYSIDSVTAGPKLVTITLRGDDYVQVHNGIMDIMEALEKVIK